MAWSSGKSLFLILAASILVAPSSAQDFSMIGSSVAGITMPQVLNPCPSGSCGKGAAHGGGSGLAVRAMHRPPSSAAPIVSLSFSATPALRKKVLDDMLSQMRSRNPQAAQAVQEMLARYDYTQIYEGVARPYGLGGDDVANVMSAYFILGWIIANGQSDVPGGAASVRAVRAQFASVLARSPAAAPQERAQTGEQMKILFAVMHAGWQGSRKQHETTAYADGIERQFQQQAGVDLRATSLDVRGFATRER